MCCCGHEFRPAQGKALSSRLSLLFNGTYSYVYFQILALLQYMYATTFADFEMMTMGAAVGAGSPMPVVCCLPPTGTEWPAAAARRQFCSNTCSIQCRVQPGSSIVNVSMGMKTLGHPEFIPGLQGHTVSSIRYPNWQGQTT